MQHDLKTGQLNHEQIKTSINNQTHSSAKTIDTKRVSKA